MTHLHAVTLLLLAERLFRKWDNQTATNTRPKNDPFWDKFGIKEYETNSAANSPRNYVRNSLCGSRKFTEICLSSKSRKNYRSSIFLQYGIRNGHSKIR